ncbi:MAG: 4-hydroxybutyrate--acetyl-CoA CoA transferase, partial [Oscillospiraceae bacterium]|nr:4-hydroxybutyrate--acetyl-CoA CoA transferase [Oscillospiraceae bacterium]
MNKFNELYNQKLMTTEQVAKMAESGWNICSDIGISIPFAIYDAIGKRVREGELENLTMQNFLDVQELPCFEHDLSGKIKGVSWFSGAAGRKAINAGHADLMPNYLRDTPALYRDYIDVDAFFTMVSPMDKHGYFSTCNAACSFAIARKAKHIFLQVNENMPRSAYTSFIHISQVTALCENNTPLAESLPGDADEDGKTIGELIAAEIPNGSTIQLGIGNIPNAV